MAHPVLRPAQLGPKFLPLSKSLKLAFLSRSDGQFELKQLLITHWC